MFYRKNMDIAFVGPVENIGDCIFLQVTKKEK